MRHSEEQSPKETTDWNATMLSLLSESLVDQKAAMIRLRRLYRGLLRRMSARLADHEVDDLFSEFVAKIVPAYRRGGIDNFYGYARAVTRTGFIDYVQSVWSDGGDDLELESVAAPECVEAADLRFDVKRSLDLLPEAHRRALEATTLADQPVHVAAATLNVPGITIRRQVERAERQLAEALREYEGA